MNIECKSGCDWCALEAAQESLREHMLIIKKHEEQIAEAEVIILQLTKHHHSDPEYVKGYDMSKEYLAGYYK